MRRIQQRAVTWVGLVRKSQTMGMLAIKYDQREERLLNNAAQIVIAYRVMRFITKQKSRRVGNEFLGRK